MTSPPAPGSGSRLQFNSPLSEERAARLVTSLAESSPGTVLDLGCGWAELLLRLLAAVPEATGTGVELHAPDLARARTSAAARDLAGRVSLVEGDAKLHPGTADVVLSIGAYQAFGTIPEALTALRSRTNPGGRLLFAAEFWEQPPPPERLAHMWPGATAGDCTDLAELVGQAITAGFRPAHIQTVSTAEWEDFESGLAADQEEWLAANPGHPEAAALRERLDAQRDMWLKGHRGLLGFAYLTLY
jgi:cyclopropane fatty-acyl-phospholipid synthase-like methyltransferase